MVRVKQGAKKTKVKAKEVVSKPEKTPESHPHQCLICGARYKWNSHLIIHSRVHSGSKPYKCSLCPLSFVFKQSLTRHLLVHSKVKPHKCSHCSQSFARLDALNVHLRLHSQTKDFSCPDCPKKFTTASILREHKQRRHSTTRDYCCSKCPKKYPMRAELNTHLKTHGILTPYSCSIPTCDQSFRLKRELLLHEATHNQNKSTPAVNNSSSTKTKSKPKLHVSFNLVSDTEESEDEMSTKKKKNAPVRKRAAVDDNENIENEPPVKKKKIKHTKNGKEENKECEFFNSKPYWCFCGQFFTTKEIFAHHQDNEDNGKHFLQLHECPFCSGPEPEVFETFEEFEDHYSSFHQPLLHECPLCGDEYSTIQELEDHLDQVDPSLFL